MFVGVVCRLTSLLVHHFCRIPSFHSDSMNAPVMVEIDGETDPLKIAMKELRERKVRIKSNTQIVVDAMLARTRVYLCMCELCCLVFSADNAVRLSERDGRSPHH